MGMGDVCVYASLLYEGFILFAAGLVGVGVVCRQASGAGIMTREPGRILLHSLQFAL